MKTGIHLSPTRFLFPAVAVALSCTVFSCVRSSKRDNLEGKDISRVVSLMTDIMLHDITNPPLSARFFSYAALAGYEVISENEPRFSSMYGSLNGYPRFEKPDPMFFGAYRLPALLAMMETAKKMQPSGQIMDRFEQRFIDSCRDAGMSADMLDRSQRYAAEISRRILSYAMNDGYRKLSILPRYAPEHTEGHWYPTPPAFMAAVEPHFDSVRSFTLDSCGHFKSVPPVPFDPAPGTPFCRLLDDVYEESKKMPDEHRNIAFFWDCNPFAVQDNGHLQYGFKKISPGAHWMGIAGIACLKANKSFDETMQVYMAVSIGLMDAFICCWHEKFRTNRIRPETAIRKYIDDHWQPLLQTPPFPEYLSGHSVISAASAVILTHYFGEHFQYVDSVEVGYGIPPRRFASFDAAAEEAGISRFYGGIHFMDGITNGRKLGLEAGAWVLKKIMPASGQIVLR